MATRCRWLQFSLRTAFVVLTAFALGLGSTVERARNRGRAIDAIMEAGGSVQYIEYNDWLPASAWAPNRDHFWDDLKGCPVRVDFDGPLDATLCSYLSELHPIDLINVRHDTEIEMLTRKLPNVEIVNWHSQ
jgi:hypothetical protein